MAARLMTAFLALVGGSTKLSVLNVDPASVVAVGFGDAADFAHQFHIAFSSMVSGACVFSGQPFHCAVSGFAGDSEAWHAKMLALNGAASSNNDHCKSNPSVVDVGSLVDYPRRHCGQNPQSVADCFDDVNYVKNSRYFLFRGMHDNSSAPGAIENVDGFLAQLITNPQRSIKVVRDQPFGDLLPLRSTPHAGQAEPAGYDGPGECLKHVFDAPAMRATSSAPANWMAFNQSEFADGVSAVGFQPSGWLYVPERCRDLNGQGPGSSPCSLVLRPGSCDAPAVPVTPEMAAYAEYAFTARTASQLEPLSSSRNLKLRAGQRSTQVRARQRARATHAVPRRASGHGHVPARARHRRGPPGRLRPARRGVHAAVRASHAAHRTDAPARPRAGRAALLSPSGALSAGGDGVPCRQQKVACNACNGGVPCR